MSTSELRRQLMRVDIAGDNLEKSSIRGTKKAAKMLGDETKQLLLLIINAIEVLEAAK